MELRELLFPKRLDRISHVARSITAIGLMTTITSGAIAADHAIEASVLRESAAYAFTWNGWHEEMENARRHSDESEFYSAIAAVGLCISGTAAGVAYRRRNNQNNLY